MIHKNKQRRQKAKQTHLALSRLSHQHAKWAARAWSRQPALQQCDTGQRKHSTASATGRAAASQRWCKHGRTPCCYARRHQNFVKLLGKDKALGGSWGSVPPKSPLARQGEAQQHQLSSLSSASSKEFSRGWEARLMARLFSIHHRVDICPRAIASPLPGHNTLHLQHQTDRESHLLKSGCHNIFSLPPLPTPEEITPRWCICRTTNNLQKVLTVSRILRDFSHSHFKLSFCLKPQNLCKYEQI